MYGYESVFESDVVDALGAQTKATEALVAAQQTANLIAAGRLAVEAFTAGVPHLNGWGEDVLSEIHTRLASADSREQMGLH